MLSAIVFAALLAVGQVAQAHQTEGFNAHNLVGRAQHIGNHHRLSRSMSDKLRRRSAAHKKRCAAAPSGTDTNPKPTATGPGAINVGDKPTETDDQPQETETETEAPETPKTTKTRTSTADKPTETPETDDNDNNSGSSSLTKSLRVLFPLKAPSSSALSWSTNQKHPNAIDFDELGITNDMKRLKHPVKTAPDGSQAMEISFQKGSYGFRNGGFSFVAYGPDRVDLTKAREVTFAYSIFFQDGFDFNKGGKLPGLEGGDSDASSLHCSGGRKSQDCFSARMMFRREGRGELYTYLPPGLKGNDGICDIPPKSDCNPDYGSSLGRGAFRWEAGSWTTMAQRVRLNSVGNNDGEMEVFINGKSVIKATGLTLRRDNRGRIRSAVMQSFFGGHEPDWASPKDQKFWLKDLSLAITEEL